MRPNIPTMLQYDWFETSHADLRLAALIGQQPKPQPPHVSVFETQILEASGWQLDQIAISSGNPRFVENGWRENDYRPFDPNWDPDEAENCNGILTLSLP